MEKLPTLYKKATTGKIQEWSILVDDTGEYPTIVMTSGYVDGKKVTTKKEVKTGVNKGKSNEQTPLEHAIFIAKSKWTTKKEEGYTENPDNCETVLDTYITPMLAMPLNMDAVDKYVKFPCYVQPKFNGVRCMVLNHLGDHRFLSRTRKEYTALDFMRDEVQGMFKSYSPDGEIYIHGTSLQDIVSLVKRKQEGTLNLKYVVYDLIDPNMEFKDRLQTRDTLFKEYITHSKAKYVQLAQTLLIHSFDELMTAYQTFISQGYEGIIIRNPQAVYHPNIRSKDLLKYKNFRDSEFTIVGAECEIYYDKQLGKNIELVIWVCMSDSGLIFHVRPLGSVSEKESLWINRDQYIGKKLTVRYLELSKDGIPIGNPVGIAIRDYE